MADSSAPMRTRLRHLPVLKGPLADAAFDSLPDIPYQAFEVWISAAIAAGVPEPHAMTVSTVDENGWPDARVLILKNVDERGWHFAVKAGSPKGQQITANPHVALTFYWPQMGRQVRIRGLAVTLPAEECATDFLDRPMASRVSAMASKQSRVLTHPTELQASLEKADSDLHSNPQYVSPEWRVYAVTPDTVEFWQGASDRLHGRLRFARTTEEGFWRRESLWP
ncbi:hypothetical protein LTR10_013182 [Elasticomyces elasticus]|uniref:pyridoxal 5'-phosphate synthase n=1 Tax=Exophiala sideris TaxID=1016849 RepID=A0ABR0JBU3_9EURO|nr:hypothetical protein LTR10_013182 [Elasticomyces elasticus]KAK5030557.1 hypothetical protein LTS07_005341 [Exophiala sideris]KAK5038611.1 hypothetical protein LTR13_004358 [Exophiala sideris]KAK5060492.1 hypothetical protein LTR69_005809 [Exophiala sideris]KAK5183404.1 hypothetical protein LTR44_004405 [Eurotiomycetes sp. CCFEE 6388]